MLLLKDAVTLTDLGL